MSGTTSDQLRGLADDCEKRARRSNNGHARNLFHLAATECRTAMTAHDGRREETLAAMTAQAGLARWYDGEFESVSDIISAGNARDLPVSECYETTLANIDLTISAKNAFPSPASFNARQLADRFGGSERTARRTIARGVRMGRPGFYCEGCHWFAEPEAFDRLRHGVLSELFPNASPALKSAHDEANH